MNLFSETSSGGNLWLGKARTENKESGRQGEADTINWNTTRTRVANVRTSEWTENDSKLGVAYIKYYNDIS